MEKAKRNRRIVKYYKAGHSMVETGKKFKLAYQTIDVILLRNAPKLIRPAGRPVTKAA